MQKVTIIGTTSWGMTLAWLLGRKKIQVSVWARSEREAEEIAANGHRKADWPDGPLPDSVRVTSKMPEAMTDSKAVILAVPSQTVRQNVRLFARYITKGTLIISAAKGIEIGSRKLVSRVIAEEVEDKFHDHICVLSGPNLSREILQDLPAVSVIAGTDKKILQQAQKLLTTPNFAVFTNSDVVGVELGGALKNIIALGAGIIDGLNYGDNTKAALMTRGLTEITALGVALGASPLTFSGLAGLGDLIATCSSTLSRNHYVGEQLALGRKLPDIVESMTEVAEGVTTTLVVRNMTADLGLEMPISERIYQILYEDADPKLITVGLMGNGKAKHELTGKKWKLFRFLRRKR